MNKRPRILSKGSTSMLRDGYNRNEPDAERTIVG